MGAIRPLPGLPSLPSPCSGLGYCLSTFLHHLQTALRNEECGYSSRIHLLARAQEIRAQLPQGADQHPCSIFLTGCKSTVCDHGQGQGSCPQLGAHRPCSQYDSCNEYPRNKPQPWSIFPPWVIWATIHMNPTNRITLAFLPKLWRIRQQGKDALEGTYSPAHLQCIFYPRMRIFNFAHLLPSSSPRPHWWGKQPRSAGRAATCSEAMCHIPLHALGNLYCVWNAEASADCPAVLRAWGNLSEPQAGPWAQQPALRAGS